MAWIKIIRGYIKNFLIPHYYDYLRPIYDLITSHCGPITSGVTFKNYVYGYKIDKVGDIWNLPLPSPLSFVKPDNHQRRQYSSKREPFKSIADQLIDVKRLDACKDFEDIYEYVYEVFTKEKRHAPLTIYDTAYRIGYNMEPKILPKKYVYLSAGALKGANCLYGIEWIIKNYDCKFAQNRRNFIRMKTKLFNTIFPGVDSVGIENMMCDFFNVDIDNNDNNISVH